MAEAKQASTEMGMSKQRWAGPPSGVLWRAQGTEDLQLINVSPSE